VANSKLVIDTDCGIDDAIAILTALGSEEYSIEGITTLSGNVPVTQVTENVLRLLSYAGREDIPVYVGASGPYVGEARSAAGIHGANGLGGIELPPSSLKVEKMNGPGALVELAEKNPGMTLVTLGPLTNLAMALNLRPGLKDLLGRVVAMGGAVERGNATQFAEFNFYADPEAVQSVLDTGILIEVLTWDACVQSALSQEDVEHIASRGGRTAELFGRLASVLLDRGEELFGVRAVPLADPLAMAYALEPDIAVERMSRGLMMELMPTVMRGASVLCEEGHSEIILSTDRLRFVDILTRHLARAG